MKSSICGIYMWEVVLPGKWFGGKYIGQSKDILKRKYEHTNALKNNQHTNRKLQKFFNKYGEKSLIFSVLFECDISELDFWEKWFIKSFNTYLTKINFNFTRGGDDGGNKRIPISLINIETGKIERANSLEEFSIIHNISRPNISSLLLGKRKFVGNWTTIDVYSKLKFHCIMNPKGKLEKIYRISKFVKKNNLHRGNFYRMLNGKIKQTKGYSKLILN